MPLDLSGDLVAAAVSKLTDALSAKGYLGSLVGRDASGGAFSNGWVFAGFDDEGRPFRDVEGTGKVAIVMHDRNEWAVNAHNTARFPVLMVVVYADSSRNPDGTMQYRDGMIRARMVNNVVNRTFHDAANVDHEWPLGVTVVSCVKADGTSFTDVPTAEGVVRALTRFEVCVAE